MNIPEIVSKTLDSVKQILTDRPDSYFNCDLNITNKKKFVLKLGYLLDPKKNNFDTKPDLVIVCEGRYPDKILISKNGKKSDLEKLIQEEFKEAINRLNKVLQKENVEKLVRKYQVVDKDSVMIVLTTRKLNLRTIRITTKQLFW